METIRKSNVVVFILLIALVFSVITPVMSTEVYADASGVGYGTQDVTSYDLPDTTGLTYPESLSNSTLNGGQVLTGTSVISGQWKWKNSNAIPKSTEVDPEDKHEIEFWFANAEDRATYKSLTTEVAISHVSKGALIVNHRPDVKNLTYGDRLTNGAIYPLSIVLDDYANPTTGKHEFIQGTWAWEWDENDVVVPTHAETNNGWIDNKYYANFKADDENYEVKRWPLNVYVFKAYPKVRVQPTTTEITYGAALIRSNIITTAALVYGNKTLENTEVPGTWEWETPNDVLEVKDKVANAVFKPVDSANYYDLRYNYTNGEGVRLSITVNKTPLTFGTPPTTNKITYGQPLSEVFFSGGTVKSVQTNGDITGTWAWNMSTSTIPSAGALGYAAKYTPNDTNNIAPLEADIIVNVDKAAPTLTEDPVAADIDYGDILSKSAFSGYEVKGITKDGTLTGKWVWQDPTEDTKDLGVGTYSRKADFIPDSPNYTTIEGINVSVKVNPAPLTIDTYPTATSIGYLDKLSDSTLSNGVVSFGGATIDGTWKWDNGYEEPEIGTASYKAIFVPSESAIAGNFAELVTYVDVEVTKGALTVLFAPTTEEINYGQPISEAAIDISQYTVLNKTGGIVYGDWEWQYKAYIPDVDRTTHTALFTPNGNNYQSTTCALMITVNPIDPTIVGGPTAQAIDYGLELSSSSITADVIGYDGETVDGSWTWEDATKILDIGANTESAVFTPNTSNYSIYTTDVSITILAQTYSANELEFGDVTGEAIAELVSPEAVITAGDALGDTELTGPAILNVIDEEIDIPGSWQWDDPTFVPTAGAQDVTIKFVPVDKNYGPIIFVINITVIQIVISPEGIGDEDGTPISETLGLKEDLGVGDTLTNSAVSGPSVIYYDDGTTTTSLSGVWKWENGDQEIIEGTNTVTAIFVPDDRDYAEIEIEFVFEVTKQSIDPNEATDEDGTTVGALVKPDGKLIPKTTIGAYDVSGPSVIYFYDEDDNYTSVSGIWSWQNEEYYLSAGAHTVNAKFTITGAAANDYSNIILPVNVTVDPIDITEGQNLDDIKKDVTPESIIYAKTTLGAYDVTGPVITYENEEIPGTWGWEDPDRELTRGSITANAIFVPNDSDYGEIVIELTIEVEPLIITPDSNLDEEVKPASDVVAKTTLGAYEITAPAIMLDGEVIPGTWTWETPERDLTAGSITVNAIFTPGDDDYEKIIVEIEIEVSKIEIVLDDEDLKDKISPDGTVVAKTSIGAYEVSAPAVMQNEIEMEGTWDWDPEVKDDVLTEGTHTIKVIFTPKDNDYEPLEYEITVEVEKITIDADDLKNSTGAAISTLLFTYPELGAGSKTGTVSVYAPTTYYKGEIIHGVWSWGSDENTVVEKNMVNTLSAIFTPADEDYDPVEVEFYLTITKDSLDPTELEPADGGKIEDEVAPEETFTAKQTTGDIPITAPAVTYEGDPIDGDWDYLDPDQELHAGENEVEIVFTPTGDDADDYAPLIITIIIYVDPIVIDPTITVDEEGDPVEDSLEIMGEPSSTEPLGNTTITGPTIIYYYDDATSTTVAIEGQWKWKDPDLVPTEGDNEVIAIFEPDDKDYAPMEYKFKIEAVDGVVNVTVVNIDKTSTQMNTNSKLQLKGTVAPTNATNQKLTWKSSDTKLATVDSNGNITSYGTEGIVKITATSNNGKMAESTIKIAAPVTKLRTPLSTMYVKKKSKYSLRVVADNGKKTVKTKLTYKSSNTKIATVNSKGVIKTKKKGTVKITITAYNGKTKVVKIKVVNKKKALTKAKVNIPKKLKAGKTKQLKIKLTPKKATNLKIRYKSSKKSVATIDNAGRIYAKKKGKTKITVKVGKKTYKKTLKVTK